MEGRQGGKAEDQGQQRKGQRLGEQQGRGSCGTCPLLNKHLCYRMPPKAKASIDPIGWQQSQEHQVMEGVGDGQEVRKQSWGTLGPILFPSKTTDPSSRSYLSALRMTFQPE